MRINYDVNHYSINSIILYTHLNRNYGENYGMFQIENNLPDSTVIPDQDGNSNRFTGFLGGQIANLGKHPQLHLIIIGE